MNRECRRYIAMLLTIILIVSPMNLAVFANEAEGDVDREMISVSSEWQGSVFGDNGGQGNYTYEHFEITENEDQTVTLRSSDDKGKIASNTEGMTYYYKNVPIDGNYELTATAHVDSWTANNQVAFGLMVRENVLENQNKDDFTGDYVAVGALDQQMKGFFKNANTTIQKEGLAFDQIAPAVNEQYELRIQKSGDLFVLTVNDEIHTIEDYEGDIQFAGLFTSRNTTVTFSDITLKVEGGQVELGEWDFRAFGSNTSLERNPEPTLNEDGSVSIAAMGGKVAAGDEGVSFHYKEVPAEANFEIKTKAVVDQFNSDSSISTPNQKSFGLMLRDEIGEHLDSETQTTEYVAVGALDTVMKGFYKEASKQVKFDPFANLALPSAREEYDLSIRKSGDTFVITVDGQTETVTLDSLFDETIYVGVYVARDAQITFSDYEIAVDDRNVTGLAVDSSEMKTEYLKGESLDLKGLIVTAEFSDGSTSTLTSRDYIVTGFDSSEVGKNTINLNYNGVTATIDLMIKALSVTNLNIKYFPVKTEYYIGDLFDRQGLVVVAEYENGFKFEELTSDQYTLTIDGKPAEDFVFESAGEVKVVVQSNETKETNISFDVVVSDAELEQLEIRQTPAKTLYFLGDELDLAGLSLYANYSDGTDVRLTAGDYDVSAFDSATTGEREVILTHKGKSIGFTVTVKEKELKAYTVTNYPKTTFATEEDFDAEGLEVSKVYDNLEMEIVPQEKYTLDKSAYDSSKAGVYDIVIQPTNEVIEAITYSVTVREFTEPEWNKMRFGQSTSDQRNYVEELENEAVRIVALEGGGKITGDHDGIAFYYTEVNADEDNFVLSANINVIEYAKTPHDGQESFGIMARDAVNSVEDASVFASNIAAVGGFSGGTREENGTQAFIRTGVLAADGEGSEGIQKQMLKKERPTKDNTYPEKNYRLTLAKTNSGYTGQLNDGQDVLFFEPELLNVQDSKIYVGFYAARLATIEVSDIEFEITAAKTDAPKVEPPQEAVTPKLDVLSLDKTAKSEYDLLLESNVDGFVTIKQGQTVIAKDQRVEASKIVEIKAELAVNNNTNFSIAFVPDDTQYLTTYEQIVRNFTVDMRSYAEGKDIYVSPKGTSTGDGTKENPLDLDTAIHFVQEGQKIVVLEGQYIRYTPLEIKKFNDGTEEAMKYLVADPHATERPVIDFDRRSEGVVHSGNYWHVEGIDFTRSAGNTKGYTIGGSHNIIENVRVYENGDTGLQISRTDSSAPREEWPAYNLVLNSVAFDNRDPSENNADGFAAKLTVGEGNTFRGCISHNNIDDGWDLYTKVGTGAIGAVTIENSIAFNNGRLTNGYEGNAGKNGFKLGGEGVHVPHMIRNSIAFGNGYFGFTSNSNPGLIAENNIGFNNEGANISFTTYAHIPTDFTINGFASIRTTGTDRDSYPAALDSDRNFMFNGANTVNKSGDELPDSVLESLEAIFERDDEGRIVSIKRDSDGEIQWGEVWETFDSVTNDQSNNEEEEAVISFTPSVINLKGVQRSNGKSNAIIRAHIELTNDSFSTKEIDVGSILLNEKVHVNGEAVVKENRLTVTFLRKDLLQLVEKEDQVPITITGQSKSGEKFKGTTFVKVLK
ncbi:bacterial Ig-like domain-containing protein [Halalkalibacter krulwichiae]|uniref:Pectate disaccharide-lyase n=1 Tax=Halalkalibacter krulwichiae TaxID=199441 RepID=A0A1X9MG24_9BACI|nr:bacterial Ig-like domain-containing protein [Halalkalibacter krulwichiae]ARK30471.1 Pectate disaccharide-lyase precursor [Halalkalibacter krulwichiae]